MKPLWAPWRMEYILGQNKPDQCIFCPDMDKIGGFDRDRLMLHVGPRTLIMMNRYPYNNGHLLVAPLRHVPEPKDLNLEEAADLWRSVKAAVAVLKNLMRPDGFNLGVNLGQSAGAGVAEHLHVHVVPRWVGDTNFMTVLGEVRSIPEHILTTFDRLRPLIARALEED